MIKPRLSTEDRAELNRILSEALAARAKVYDLLSEFEAVLGFTVVGLDGFVDDTATCWEADAGAPINDNTLRDALSIITRE